MKKTTISEHETILFGEEIINKFSEINLFIIKGKVGVGKTVVVRGIARGLNITEQIKSPSFAIKNHYKNLVHYDLYFADKLKSKEFLTLLDQDLEENIVVIEWGEKISQKYLRDYVLIDIKINQNGHRTIRVKKV
ncbi:MAG: tRNA (adenosine(37)-N6)-threonylcarbamoyltransferase complex ATPase subunit type 1 TsaE [Mycoplasmataceae bacterium]|nr:tRNA (adenosine(37)-N6)-threonylcarbamoyltransferase complex ATPase subunit type 1 TsaE [Mycoplasmataceae bacterium]